MFTLCCWDLCQFGFIVTLVQVNGLLTFNYFIHLPFKDSHVSKSQITSAVALSLVFNKEFCDDMDVGYQAPLTRDRCNLPHGSHFYKTEGIPPAHHLCHHDRFHGKWDGAKFPDIKIMHSKMTCKSCAFQIQTFFFCNWSQPTCTQCHGIIYPQLLGMFVLTMWDLKSTLFEVFVLKSDASWGLIFQLIKDHKSSKFRMFKKRAISSLILYTSRTIMLGSSIYNE